MGTIQSLMISRSRPQIYAARARDFAKNEIQKGCLPNIYPEPVALEPKFQSLGDHMDLLSRESPMTTEIPFSPGIEELRRLRVWLSPEQRFDWRCSESFLKQILRVQNRLGFEIFGNTDGIQMSILCHKEDEITVKAAFMGVFNRCTLIGNSDEIVSIKEKAWANMAFHDYYPPPPYSHLMTRPDELLVSPYESLLTNLSDIPGGNWGLYQVIFQPTSHCHNWNQNVQVLIDFEHSLKGIAGLGASQRYAQQAPSGDSHYMASTLETKAHNDKPFYAMALRVALIGENPEFNKRLLPAITTMSNLFQHGGNRLDCLTQEDYKEYLTAAQLRDVFLLGQTFRPGFLVNSQELTSAVHIPSTDILENRTIPIGIIDPLAVQPGTMRIGTPIGKCYIGDIEQIVHISPTVASRHCTILGSTGMGKSTFLGIKLLSEVSDGTGAVLIDPHGDLAIDILRNLPKSAIERTIYFKPSAPDYVYIWNPLIRISGQEISRAADDLLASIKNVVEGWGDRLALILRNAIYSAMHLPNPTFMDIWNLLRPKSVECKTLVAQILKILEDETVRQYWEEDFKTYQRNEFNSSKHKLNKLFGSKNVRLMLSQSNSYFSLRQIIDDGYILLVDLSNLGHELTDFLGSYMISLFHLAALSRADTLTSKRKPFHLYCDEAHRFMTDSIDNLIQETRKFGVYLTLSSQGLGQFSSKTAAALLSVGSIVTFNVGDKDARTLSREFCGKVKDTDITDLECYNAIAKIDKEIVRFETLGPLSDPDTNYSDEIIAQTKLRYCKPVDEIQALLKERYNHPDPLPSTIAVDSSNTRPDDAEFRFDEFP